MLNLGLLNSILESLRSGKLDMLTASNLQNINEITLELLNKQKEECNTNDISKMRLIIIISNILYNNTDMSVLPLDDGVYDLLLEKYKEFDPNYQVGAEPILFNQTNNEKLINDRQIISPINVIDIDSINNGLYSKDILNKRVPITNISSIVNPIIETESLYISKRIVNTPHKYPKLVGTLDKCKFVLNQQAKDRGVYDDSNVKIFERDFIGNHVLNGLIDPNSNIKMVAELKYDGVSIEAEVSDRVISARSRGDTNNDVATDLTPILGGYRFRNTHSLLKDNVIGMKFEAIITKQNLYKLNQLRGKEYKNCRNAIIGILGASDGYLYRDYITLVPLATSVDMDRITEIEFMNRYYNSGEYLRYAVLEGDYKSILFQAKAFTEEMEHIRQYLPFLYDGVVLSYVDDFMINKLGRQNSVNKYSIAIKFNPMKRETMFLGYSYTVGQNGIITPMIHYNPIEFYGGIHTKSTGNSYARFNELQLRIGDIITLEYVNDVMPRVSKPDIEHNRNNTNPVEQFTKVCPSCGSGVIISETGKSAYCPNKNCPERSIARMANMLQKLELKDFSEESLKVIAKNNLTSLMNLNLDSLELLELGPVNAQKFISRMESLKTDSMYDYKIIGALGFSGIAQEKWKLILNKVSIKDIITLRDDALYSILVSIKGIGDNIAKTIVEERYIFNEDLNTINNMHNIISTFNTNDNRKIIRITGFRDKALMELLENKGYDVSDGSVTKSTDYLIVPSYGFSSTKVDKATNYGVKIISIDDFMKTQM